VAAEVDADLVRARRGHPGLRPQHGVYGHHARPPDPRAPGIPQVWTLFSPVPAWEAAV